MLGRDSGREVVAGSLYAVVVVCGLLGYAAMIFSGPELEPYVPAAVQSMLMATWIMQLLIAIGSSLPFATAAPDSNYSAMLAVVAANVVVALAGSRQAIGPTVIAMLAVSALLTGGLALAIGLARRGRIARLMPYPVAGGFIAGTGFLVASGGFKVLSKQPLTVANLALAPRIPPLALVTAVGVAAAMLVVPRFTRHYLVTPGIIAGGVALFAVAGRLSGLTLEAARARGFILEPVAPGPLLPYAGMLGTVSWGTIAGQWANLLTVSVVVVLGITLNAAGLELATQHDADFDRELRVNGLANLVAGFAGGTTGGLSASRTILMVKAGASSRVAGVWAALVCLGATFFLKPVLFLFPEPVLAGLLLGIGIGLMRDWLWDTFFRLPLLEYLLIVFIVLAIVIYGLLPGISFGFVVAGLLFVYRYGHTDHVRHNFPISMHGSNRERSLRERAALTTVGHRARALCLHGYLFFGTAQSIVETCRSLIVDEGVDHLVLDFRLVEGIDASAVTSFAKLGQLCARTGAELAFAGLNASTRQSLDKMQILGGPIREFPDLDRALESAEDRLLGSVDDAAQAADGSAQWQRIEELTGGWTLVDLAEGGVLFRKGDAGDSMYLIEQGELSVSLDLGGGRRKRLRSYGPGTIVGEMAMYTGAPRSADVIADTDCRLRRLDASELALMQVEAPEVAIEIHNFIVRLLARRLAAANEEISLLL